MLVAAPEKSVPPASFPKEALTYLSGHHRDVVPLGHFPVQGLQRGDGAVGGVDVEQPLQIRVPVNGVSERMTRKIYKETHHIPVLSFLLVSSPSFISVGIWALNMQLRAPCAKSGMTARGSSRVRGGGRHHPREATR